MTKMPQATFIRDRTEYLRRLCEDRSVLHLGFADAIHFDAALEEGRHLHAELKRVTSPDELYGVDISEDRVRHFRDIWTDDNLLVGDVEKLDELPIDRKFDVIIAGELIEHLNNPGLMLRGVHRFMRKDSRFVITTPNGLGLKFQLHALAGNDRSHWDHCVLFSFSTLNTLLRRHQLEPKHWYTAIETFGGRRNQVTRPVLDRLFQLRPQLPETLIVESVVASE